MWATLGGTVWRYIYNGDRILQETDNARNELYRHITESPSYYAPLLWTRSEQYSGGGNYRFALYDATGNVRKLTSTALSAGVQNQGAGMDYYKYDAFLLR